MVKSLTHSLTANPVVELEYESHSSGPRISDITTALGLCVYSNLVL